MPNVSKAKAVELLREQQSLIAAMKSLSRDEAGFKKWRRDTEIALATLFGEKSRNIKDFMDIAYSPGYHSFSDPNMGQVIRSRYLGGLDVASAILQSMIEEVEKFWPDESETSTIPTHAAGKPPSTNDVFVVHGRDDGPKDAVAAFLRKLGLNPIILHEKPNQGRTIIEKFEKESNVAFAVVLLTPDDVGALAGEESNLKPRARQNVIFELGYFTGNLGRERVCALTKGDVEKPSDYDGVVYIPFDDSGAWQMALVKELRSAGLDADANRAL